MSDGVPALPAAVEVRLAHRLPLALEPLLRFVAAHAVPGVEQHDPLTREHTLLVPGEHGPALVTVRFPLAASLPDGHLSALLRLADASDEAGVLARVRSWLDLDADPEPVARALAGDPVLAPLVRLRPGLRVPGTTDGLQTALFAVLGQQVSLAAARTFAGRLLRAYGTVPTVAASYGLAHLSDPRVLADAGPEAIQQVTGVTRARARTLHHVAEAAAGGLQLDRRAFDGGADRQAAREALLALPGIGPWTADYVALRCLVDVDAYPAGDLVLRRALGVRTARQAEERAERWRPWRGYALLHLSELPQMMSTRRT